MTIRSIVTFILLLCFAVSAQQQTVAEVEKMMPPIKLATKVDKNGQKQWDASPHQNCPACKAKKTVECTHCAHMDKVEKCVMCNKTRKAPCNYCQGTGALADPLKKALCPGCFGNGVLFCQGCGNRGKITWVGGGKRGVKCGMCKGNGGVPCTVCGGKKLVQTPFKGKLSTQKLKKLKSARKNLSLLIRQGESFVPLGKGRVDRKKFNKMFGKVKADFPVLKKLNKFVDGVMKKLDRPQVQDNDKFQQSGWRRSKTYLLYYLVHQGKVVDACIERVEANAKAAAAAPKK